MISKCNGTGQGTVVAIRRYPVKSMRAEGLDAAELHWTGLHGDRQYAFMRQADTSDFPWLTAREAPGLVLYRPCYSDPARPARARVRITGPDGAEYDVRDPVLTRRLAEVAATPVRLLRMGRGVFDAMPVSIVTTTMGAAVEQAHGSPVDLGRFRSNLVIRPDNPAVTEQDWLGHSLSFGEGPDPPSLHVSWPIPRCSIVAVDPHSAVRDASVVRTVVRQFANAVGAYGAVRRPGTIRVGDRVRLAAV